MDEPDVQNSVKSLRSELAEARVEIARLKSDQIFLISELNRRRQFIAYELGVSLKLGKVLHTHGQFVGTAAPVDGSADKHEWVSDVDLDGGHGVSGLGRGKKRFRCPQLLYICIIKLCMSACANSLISSNESCVLVYSVVGRDGERPEQNGLHKNGTS